MKSLTLHPLAAKLVLLLPALMLASCGQTPAPSKPPLEGKLTTQALPANGTYKLLNVLSGKAMEVTAGSLENGAKIQQFEDNGTDSQRWVFSRNADNSYTVTNLKSKNVLDIEGGTAENGARAQQWVDSSGTNQHFDLTDLGNSVVSLTAKHSAKVVEVSNFSRDNGGRVQQWDWANADSQKWKLVAVSGLPNSGLTPLPSKKLSSGLYKMAFNYSGNVLEVADGATLNGDPIGEGTDTGLNSSRQLWNFVSQSDGSYTIKNVFSGKVMDVSGVSLERGAKIHQWDDYGNANQRFDVFVYSDANSNTVSTRISARHSGRAVVIPKSTASSYSSSTQAAQDYVFGAPDAPHDYVVVWDLTKVTGAPTPTPQPIPGSTVNNSSELKAALARGGEIQVNAGQYDLGTVVVMPNTKLIGTGLDTVIKGTLKADDASNITLSNLAFRGDPTLELAIDFGTAKNLKISNLDIQNYHSSGITLKSVSDSVLSDINIAKSTRDIFNSSGGLAYDGYTTALRIGPATNTLFKNVTIDASLGGKAAIALGGWNTPYKGVVFDGLKLITTGKFEAPWCCFETITTSPEISISFWGVTGNVTIKNSTFIGGALSLAGQANKTSFTFENNQVQCTQDFQYGVEVYGDLVGKNNTFTGPCYAAYASFGAPGTITTTGDTFSGARVNGDNTFTKIDIR